MTEPPSGRVKSVDQSVRVQRGVSWVGGRHVERLRGVERRRRRLVSKAGRDSIVSLGG